MPVTHETDTEPYEKHLTHSPGWALEEGGKFFEKRSLVHQTMREIARELDRLGIPYAVCGGMALSAHGFTRFTDDVDILVTHEGRLKLHAALSGRGYLPPFEKSKHLRNTETRVKIEFLESGDFPGDGREKPVAFPEPDADVIEVEGIRYLGLRTLIELKLASGISGANRQKDLVDVGELIQVLLLPRTFSEQLDPSVAPEFARQWDKVLGIRRRYLRLWRDARLTTDVRSIDDMIVLLQSSAGELRGMQADGIVLDPVRGVSDDGAYLLTEDPIVAAKWDFHDEREFE